MDEDIVSALRRATKDCSDRGLIYASKWAAELLLSIPAERRKARPKPEDTSIARMTTEEEMKEADLEEEEQDVLSAARAYGEAKEFLRASNIIEQNKCKSARARFMSLYYKFLASEKRALRDWHNLDYMLQIPKNPRQPPTPVNNQLRELLITPLFSVTDPWLLFFNAMLLKRLGRREEAVTQAFLSIKAYPWNWSCWQVICACISDSDELYSLTTHLPLQESHPLVQLFTVHVMNQLHSPQESELDICDQLLGNNFFPNSTWIMSLRASVLYHMHDYQRAEKEFDKLIEADPYRIDDIDTLSNILYVAENRVKLSKVAHHYLAIDKDRPEVCVLIGNHYSLRCEREKAIAYFRRATELDPNCLAAWTLMGHEYIEQKNSHAAIEAYRRAIDANRKDYRAWYGLGQAYELLNMHQYSLHYFQRASALRPYDVRIWQAQATCYEAMGRCREAIECQKRALLGSDIRDISINEKIGILYSLLGEKDLATEYHQRVVDICEADRRPTSFYAYSLLCVGQHHMRSESDADLDLAKRYLDRVAASNSEQAGIAVILLEGFNKKLAERAAKSGIPEVPPDGTSVGNTDNGSGIGTGNSTNTSTIPLGLSAGASVPSVSLSDAPNLRTAYGAPGPGFPGGPP